MAEKKTMKPNYKKPGRPAQKSLPVVGMLFFELTGEMRIKT
jgi:hypothetical protein